MQSTRKIQRDFVAARDPVTRQAREQKIQSPATEHCAADATEENEKQRLRQVLARDSHPAGSEREPNGDLALPSGGADNLQAGDVSARDQEHEQRRTDHEEKTFGEISDHPLSQRDCEEIPALVKLWIVLRKARRDRRQFCFHRRSRYAGLQTPDHTPIA